MGCCVWYLFRAQRHIILGQRRLVLQWFGQLGHTRVAQRRGVFILQSQLRLTGSLAYSTRTRGFVAVPELCTHNNKSLLKAGSGSENSIHAAFSGDAKALVEVDHIPPLLDILEAEEHSVRIAYISVDHRFLLATHRVFLMLLLGIHVHVALPHFPKTRRAFTCHAKCMQVGPATGSGVLRARFLVARFGSCLKPICDWDTRRVVV